MPGSGVSLTVRLRMFLAHLFVLIGVVLAFGFAAYFAGRSERYCWASKMCVFAIPGALIGFIAGLLSISLQSLLRIWLAYQVAGGRFLWLAFAIDWMPTIMEFSGVLGMLAGIMIGVAYAYARGHTKPG
jgi:hypothetical protein